MRLAALFALFTSCLTACFESESDTKKVELVDNTTKNDPDAGTQAVSDEDFAALQDKVKTLESKLAALESGKADAADMTALETDVSSNTTSIGSLNTSVGTLNTTVSGQGTRLTAAEADIAAHDS